MVTQPRFFIRVVAPYLLCIVGVVIILTAWRPVDLNDGVVTAVTQAQFQARLQLLVGLGLVSLAVWLFAKPLAPRPFSIPLSRESLPLRRTFWPLSLLGAGCLILLGFWISPEYRIWGFRLDIQGHLGNYWQLVLLFGGSALWVLGWMTRQDPGRIVARLRQSLRLYRHEWLLVAGLTLAALGVRLYRLDEAIPLMVSDESAYLVAARRIFDGHPVTIAHDMHFGDLYLGAYVISLWFNFLSPSLFVGRLTVAIVGSLAIPGVYLMTRRLFGWKAAWFASLFLLTQPLHVHFSRIALYNMYDLTMGLLAVLLLWDGLERGGRWKFALAGVLIGIAQYYYAGALIWLLLIPLWLLLQALRQPRAVFSHAARIALLAISALLVQFPMLAYFAPNDLSPLQHSANMSEGEGDLNALFDKGIDHYFTNLSRAVRAYVDLGDTTRHFQPGGTSQLNNRWALLIFLVGLAALSRYALHPGLLFLLLWLGLMLFLGGVLMRDTPGFSRYTVITAPMAAIAGIGLAWFLERWQALWSPRYATHTFALGLAVMFLINVRDVRLIQGSHNDLWIQNASPSRFVSYAIALDAWELTQQGHQPVFIFRNDDDLLTDRHRLLEVYQYHCGITCPYQEVFFNQPGDDVTIEWLTSLQHPDDDLYIFVLPTPGTPFDVVAPPPPNSPVNAILAAFPDASFERVNNTRYEMQRNFALYTLVEIPAGAELSPSGSHLQMGGG
jgi:4-amino-4-deoxy-L-arabinose transferase-like glycosyltransferase